MEKHEILRDFTANMLKFYEESFNSINEGKAELIFETTLTHHKVDAQPEIEGGEIKKINIAYFRVARTIKDLSKEDSLPEKLIIHNGYFPFENHKQKKEEKDMWMSALYEDFIRKLGAAGLEYLETLQQMRKINERTKAEFKAAEMVQSQDSEIQVTSEMPAPLTAEEAHYKQWVDENNEHVKKS